MSDVDRAGLKPRDMVRLLPCCDCPQSFPVYSERALNFVRCAACSARRFHEQRTAEARRLRVEARRLFGL